MPGLADKPAAIRAVVKGLVEHLRTAVPNLETVLDNFPSPNQKMIFPAVSVHARTPSYVPIPAYVIQRGAASGPSNNRVATIRRAVGLYDFELQLDLWAAYKPQRDSLFEEIVTAFNQDSAKHGIDLTLADYFNEHTHFSLAGGEYLDGEESAQRNEWRAIWTVHCSVRVVSEKSEHIIETIENNLETPSTITSSESEPEVLL